RRRLPTESAVQRHHVFVAEIEPVERSDDITVALAETTRNARRSRLGNRNVERSEAFDQVIASDAEPRLAGEFAELGLACTDQDRTADRVAAEQRALRPAQHLDTGDVAELQRAANRAADIDLVDVDAHTRVDRSGGVELSDAADEHHRSGGVTRELTGRLELQARRDPLEIGGLDDLALLQRLCAECRD